MYIVQAYSAYLVITIAVTIWVARTLHHGGRPFLIEAFHGNKDLADSVNRLLVVGFYLINLGWVALSLSTTEKVDTVREAIEIVSEKIGVILIVLGAMHFLNLFIFQRLRRNGQEYLMPPPLPPDMQLEGSR